MNETPLTDSRAPLTPKEIVALNPAQQRKVFYKLRDFRLKRNKKTPGARQREINVGSFVRVALREAAKGTPMKNTRGPRQIYSAKSYRVVAKTGQHPVRFKLRGIPRRRFVREDVLLIPKELNVEGKNLDKKQMAGTRRFKADSA